MLEQNFEFSSLNAVLPCSVSHYVNITFKVIVDNGGATVSNIWWMLRSGSLSAFTQSQADPNYFFDALSVDNWKDVKGISVPYISGYNVKVVINGVEMPQLSSNPQYITFMIGSSSDDQIYVTYTAV